MTQQPPDPPPVEDSGYGTTPPPPLNPPYADDRPNRMVSPEERNWAMLCHLTVFSGYVIPLGNIIGPLVVWLVKRDEFPAVDFHGKEALNFQISILIYIVVSIVLIFFVVGVFLLIAVALANLVCTVIATIKAGQGEYYRYPLSIRFIT
jgi:uncharacterized Tic20 family protein